MNNISRAQIVEGLEAKKLAFTILNNVFVKKMSLSEAFKFDKPRYDALSSQDKTFVRLLVMAVIKHASEIDLVLQRFLYEKISDLRPNTLINVFRLGIAQFAFLKVAPYSVVHTTVDLVEAEDIAHQKSLVNTVMRRITSEGFPDIDFEDSVKVNIPEWLWKEWSKDYGEEVTKQIAGTFFNDAPVDISVRKDPEKWAKTLGGTLLPSCSIRKDDENAAFFAEDFSDNDWWVQNAADALPVKLMGDIRDKDVIDLCSAPGYKTAQLFAAKANVVAVERFATRLKQLQENMGKLGFDVETVVADGTVWKPERLVDVLLLDAPSTSTGSLRHKPDLLYLKNEKDQETSVSLQRNLITNAVNMIKPGGMLIYCVNSLQKAEGEKQFDWILNNELPLKPYPIRADEIDGISEMVTMRGELRVLPYHWEELGGMDGMYVARFIKA